MRKALPGQDSAAPAAKKAAEKNRMMPCITSAGPKRTSKFTTVTSHSWRASFSSGLRIGYHGRERFAREGIVPVLTILKPVGRDLTVDGDPIPHAFVHGKR